MKILRRTEFGNQILRQKTATLTLQEILSDDIQNLIKDMQFTVEQKKYGVGLAAPQVGKSLALCIVAIKPTPTRPDSVAHTMVILNPMITQYYGRRKPMWEGCISGTQLYAKVPRYHKIRLAYTDENGKNHETDFRGLVAHVIQHEVDHLNGILFVDKVKDSTTFTTFREYIKMNKAQKLNHQSQEPQSPSKDQRAS